MYNLLSIYTFEKNFQRTVIRLEGIFDVAFGEGRCFATPMLFYPTSRVDGVGRNNL